MMTASKTIEAIDYEWSGTDDENVVARLEQGRWVERLEDASEIREDLMNLLLTELPRYYDGVDMSFVDSLIEAGSRTRDQWGYFTMNKEIYVLRNERDLLAFTVCTHKRGGSVKIGPTGTPARYRRQGYASQLRDVVEEHLFHHAGARKLYMTISTQNSAALSFNLERGFQVEGVLKAQYKRANDECVLAKFPSTKLSPIAAPKSNPAPNRRYRIMSALPSIDELASFLTKQLEETHRDIDREFAESVVQACSEDRQQVHLKGKHLICLETGEGSLGGVVVCIPKRGGSVKLSPVVAKDIAGFTMLADLGRAWAIERGAEKVFMHLPVVHGDWLQSALRSGWILEATLREAYRESVDIAVLRKDAR